MVLIVKEDELSVHMFISHLCLLFGTGDFARFSMALSFPYWFVWRTPSHHANLTGMTTSCILSIDLY